jgi:4-hydroxyphenylacetate 3-monooxygenase
VDGPQAQTIARYYQAARADARQRIRLFRLAWDLAVSAFGSRQVLYERFFFGDPVRMAGVTFTSYDKTPYIERVRQFLARADAAMAPQTPAPAAGAPAPAGERDR